MLVGVEGVEACEDHRLGRRDLQQGRHRPVLGQGSLHTKYMDTFSSILYYVITCTHLCRSYVKVVYYFKAIFTKMIASLAHLEVEGVASHCFLGSP